MARDARPRNVAVLAALLVVLAVVAIVRLRPVLVSGAAAGNDKAVHVGSYSVPVLGWDRLEERVVPTPRAGRNLFTFGAPPTPTPEGIYVNGKWILPPPPSFSLSYLGWLGPNRLPVAIFRDGDEVLAVAVGETVKLKFIVREVDPTGVTIGFVGYPPNVTSKVVLAR